MPVYNGAKYLGEAIESILNQTFTDFEFIIIDDCSNDNSLEIIREYSDKRIRVIKNRDNIGLSKTLNLGLELAKGKYLARMDQDDISIKNRLEREVDILDQSPDCGLVSTNCYLINDNGEVSDRPILSKSLSGGQVEWYLFWENPIIHPSVMFPTQHIRSLNGYPEIYKFYVEDYVLWLRLLKTKSIVVLREPLLYLKKHDLNATQVNLEQHIEEYVKVNQEILAERLNYYPLPESIRLLGNLSSGTELSLFHTRMSIVLLINAYKYLVRKHQLNNTQLRDIQSDFLNRFIRLIKLNIPYGMLRVSMVLGQTLFLLPISMLNRLNKETMVKLILAARFHHRNP